MFAVYLLTQEGQREQVGDLPPGAQMMYLHTWGPSHDGAWG